MRGIFPIAARHGYREFLHHLCGDSPLTTGSFSHSRFCNSGIISKLQSGLGITRNLIRKFKGFQLGLLLPLPLAFALAVVSRLNRVMA
jgi:hypothetical protein